MTSKKILAVHFQKLFSIDPHQKNITNKSEHFYFPTLFDKKLTTESPILLSTFQLLHLQVTRQVPKHGFKSQNFLFIFICLHYFSNENRLSAKTREI